MLCVCMCVCGVQVEGVPGEVSAGTYQVRVIVRDVSGKYTWDSTLLHGPDSTLEGKAYTLQIPRGSSRPWLQY